MAEPCSYASKGCAEPGLLRVTWPGQPPRVVCTDHFDRLSGIAGAMGFELTPQVASVEAARQLNEMFTALQAQVRLQREADEEG